MNFGQQSPRTRSPTYSDDLVSPGSRRSSLGPSDARVSFRDVFEKIRFSHSARLLYITCVALTAALIAVAAAFRGSMHELWFHALEALLTLLFAVEVLYRIGARGPIAYFTSKANMAEACACCFCIAMLVLSYARGGDESEDIVEALVICLRYVAMLGRLCFFVRSTSAQTVTTTGRVEIQPYDNVHIGIPVVSSATLPKYESAIWVSYDNDRDAEFAAQELFSFHEGVAVNSAPVWQAPSDSDDETLIRSVGNS
ncbi:hypothetical protein DIPPA_27770 [Diplonema papillatum]|nr:hypothetical protein DIPPA_27770 [Diplonema papillatum]